MARLESWFRLYWSWARPGSRWLLAGRRAVPHLGALFVLIVLCLGCGQAGSTRDQANNGGANLREERPPATLRSTALAATAPLEPTVTPEPIATLVPTAIPTPVVEFVNSVGTTYYEVFGSTSREILDYIELNGPRSSDGESALGVATVYRRVTWQTIPQGNACRLASATISLDLGMQLPQMANPLEPYVAGRWAQLALDVAEHEQRHVDIYLEGAGRLQANLQSIEVLTTCLAVDSEVERLRDEEWASTEANQEAFHAEDEARIAALQAPLRQQIASNQAEMAALEVEIASLKARLGLVDSTMGEIEAQLDGLQAELDRIAAPYPSGVLPPEVYSRHEAVGASYNGLFPPSMPGSRSTTASFCSTTSGCKGSTRCWL